MITHNVENNSMAFKIALFSLNFYFVTLMFFNGTAIFYLGTSILIFTGLLYTISRGKITFNRYIISYFFFIFFNIINTYLGSVMFLEYSRNRLNVIILNFFIAIIMMNLWSDLNLRKSFSEFYVKITFFFIFYITILDLDNLFRTRLAIDLNYPFELPGKYNSNIIGYFICFAILILVLDEGWKKNIKKIVKIAILFLYLILLGGRKTFIIGLSLIIIPSILTKTNAKKKLKNIAISIAVISIVLYCIYSIPFLYDQIGYRIFDAYSGIINDGGYTESSAYHRSQMNKIALSYIKKAPVFGYGLDSFSQLSPYGTYSHNNFFEILLGSGVIGLVLYYIPYIFIVNSIIKIKESYLKYLYLTFICVFIILEYSVVSYLSREIMVINYFIYVHSIDNSKGET